MNIKAHLSIELISSQNTEEQKSSNPKSYCPTPKD